MRKIFSNDSVDDLMKRWIIYHQNDFVEFFSQAQKLQQTSATLPQTKSAQPHQKPCEEHLQISPLSYEECFKLMLWSEMGDEQWDAMKQGLAHFGHDILYCSKTIRDNIKMDEQQKIQKELGIHELSTSPGGVCTSVKQTILWLLLLFFQLNNHPNRCGN
jgi:hypothetical protein